MQTPPNAVDFHSFDKDSSLNNQRPYTTVAYHLIDIPRKTHKKSQIPTIIELNNVKQVKNKRERLNGTEKKKASS